MPRPERTYTIEEANALVPEVRSVLLQLAFEQARLDRAHADMHRRLEGNGDPAVLEQAGRDEAGMANIAEGMRSLRAHLEGMGIQVRDSEIGLVDFPAARDGRRVWLCWRLADPRVEHWHGTDEGYATRRRW